jgi:serine/threonine-protein kinase
MSPSSLEGTNLGKFRILEALGRGGMAQVYRAYHPQLDRYVAVKVLRSDLVEQDEFLARFRREAHAVSGLRHANIVQVFDFDVQDDLYYMVMELLEGDSLRARLNDYRVRGQRMPLPEVARILKDVLAGLAYAHSEGIIHRDIKPANIMLTKKGQAVLTDFGIAQIVGSTQYTVSGALMGTLNYMAPEQGFKGQCDNRSDIYSLGIVLYEMLTGYTPFDADTPLAILMKHLNDPLPLPSQLDPSIPPALETVVLRALAKEPDDRFQTAEEMSAALEQAEAALPETARPIVPPPGGMASQAVFSGTERGKITDHRFANGDTDAVLPRPGLAPVVSAPEIESPINAILLSLTNGLAKLPIFNISPVSGVFGGLGLFVLMNGFAGMAAAFSGRDVMSRAWPIEIFLTASLLAMIGWGTLTQWMIVPGGMVFGNAILLAYCTLTGRWGDWTFLWAFELLVIYLSIALPVRLGEIRGAGPVWARFFGAATAIAAVTLSALTIILGTLVAK